jgi:Dolichyl-phosphate-mannose-protein mannosyltransferase
MVPAGDPVLFGGGGPGGRMPQAERKRLFQRRSLLEWVDRNPAALLPVVISPYLAIVLRNARRPLWFDELFTYYISTSRSLSHFLSCILNVDLNPPLSYGLVWLSTHFFGQSPTAVRLPAIASFLIAGLAVFALVRRRLGGLLGLTAMVLVWSTGFIYYAAEARPYAILLASLSLAVLFWERMESRPDRSATPWLFSASVGGMLLSHCFSVFFLAPFFMAEAMRSWEEKHVSGRRLAALLAPLPAMALYIPLVRRGREMLFPAAFQPSWHKVIALYFHLFHSPCGWLGVALLLGLALLPTRWRTEARVRRHEFVLVAGLLFMPLVLILFLARGHVAYWPRYCIGSALGASLAITFLVAGKAGRSATTGFVTLLLAVGGFCLMNGLTPASDFHATPPPSRVYREIHPDLPFVTASGVTFLEMDHREGADFVRRLYYLTDHDAAVRYAHATIFDGLAGLRRYFPIRANVEQYKAFIAAHNHFLVFATPGYPEDWLLAKLKDDGAVIRQIGEFDTDYLNRFLFEVSIPGERRVGEE